MNQSIAAPVFGTAKIYVRLCSAVGSEDTDPYAVIWNIARQTIAPVRDLHGGNHLQ